VTALAYGSVGALLFVGLGQVHGRFILRHTPPFPHVLTLWIVGAAAVSVSVLVAKPAHPMALSVLNLSVYLCLGEIYLFLYAAAVGSLSIQIMEGMLNFDSAPDALQRALVHHSPITFLELRLQNLQAQGLLIEVDGQYRVTSKGRRWARWACFLKRALAVGSGG
jgi:hypothetical protein